MGGPGATPSSVTIGGSPPAQARGALVTSSGGGVGGGGRRLILRRSASMNSNPFDRGDSMVKVSNNGRRRAHGVFGVLRAREAGQHRVPWRVSRATSVHRFRGMQLRQSADTYDPEASKAKLSILRHRSDITEMIVAEGVLLALTSNGVCAAFDRTNMTRICFMNIADDEIIRSLFFNKCNRAVITVSVYRHNQFSALKCRSTLLDDVIAGRPSAGIAVFESESLKYPGFIEFDEVNSKVLTFSAEDLNYKVWELDSYTPLYEFRDSSIHEVKVSLGIMIIIYQRANKPHLLLKLIDINSGATIKEFQHMLKRNRGVEFIELFNEKMLIKQDGENLMIVDVRNGGIVEVSHSEFSTPSAFIFLYENQLFLTFKDGLVSAWNFAGQIVTRFKDHNLFNADCHTNCIFITRAQDLLISYCTSESSTRGSINISNVFSGDSIGKISCRDTECDTARSLALDHVSSLCYCEETHTIYTGNTSGKVFVWQN